jgi:hypothetical protein
MSFSVFNVVERVEKRIPSQLRPKRKTEEKTKKQEYIKVF